MKNGVAEGVASDSYDTTTQVASRAHLSDLVGFILVYRCDHCGKSIETVGNEHSF